MGPGDDQVNLKLEGNGHWESWTRTHLLAVCTWTCSSCSQEKNVFLFKAPEKTNSLPTANAVKQLSGVYRNDETSPFFFSLFIFSVEESHIDKDIQKLCTCDAAECIESLLR